MKLYSAIANPISLEGRIRICRGALRNTDYRPMLKSLAIPIIVVHGTDNMLVSAANADSLLDGRPARHIWSHEHQQSSEVVAATGPAAEANPVDTMEGQPVGGAAVTPGALETTGSTSDDPFPQHNVLLEPRAIGHLVVRYDGQNSSAVGSISPPP
jgi:hypothetical protein